MKLYYHPASTTSRTVMLFAAEAGIALDMQIVDLFTGEHYKPPFEAVNPNHLIPVLEDGDFRLTESSAILKYLADQAGSPLYPKEAKARARVNERMDWVNTQLCRDLAYGTVYPQIFATHKRRSEEAHDATLQWGKERAQGWLRVMNDHFLAGQPWLAGGTMTIADLFAAPFVALAELVGSDFTAYPNVRAWLARMKALPSWAPTFAAIDGYGATLQRDTLQPV
ncbi:MAG TPA: glutathione S-transferase family protein [Burkholderiaceae bacterium]|nr:glutathione S-transferase family protein [Burkholderiaceae bacterium]